MILVERPHPGEQLPVPPLLGLVVRGADQHQRRGIGRELLAATVRALQLGEERVEAREVLVRITVVPNAHRQQRKDVHEVVVEQDRKLGGVAGSVLR